MSRPKLKDLVANQKLLHVTPETTVADAIKKMQERRYSAVPVLDGVELAGVFTTTDMVCKVLDAGLDPRTTRVMDVMTTSPHCLDGNCQEIEAIRVMRDSKIHHIIVTGVGDVGYAIVTRADFPACDVTECDDELEFEQRLWEEM